MNDDQILEEIAYLDSGSNDKFIVTFSSNEIMALVRDVIQIEMAKQGHLRKTEDLSVQMASLEKRMNAMRREFIRQRGTPSVLYIRGGQKQIVSSPVSEQQPLIAMPDEPKLPRAMIAFYTLGLGFSLVFAVLLALSAVKIETIHPFISLLGLIGGLGWLTTAWTDLLSWKREKPIGNRTTKTEGSNAA